MAQPFSFSFNDEDIEDDTVKDHAAGGGRTLDFGKQPALVEPQLHTLDEMVSSEMAFFLFKCTLWQNSWVRNVHM